MSTNDIPVVYFFRKVVDPFIIVSLFALSVLWSGYSFEAYHLLMMVIVFLVSSYVYDRVNPYHEWEEGSLIDYAGDVVLGWIIIILVISGLGYFTQLGAYIQKSGLLAWFILTPLALIFSHVVMRKMAEKMLGGNGVRSAVIVGANKVGIELAERIANTSYSLIENKGFFDDRMTLRNAKSLHSPILGRIDEVSDYVRKNGIQMIFVSLPMSAHPRIRELLDGLQNGTASIYFVPDIYVFDLMHARTDSVGGMPVVAVCETPFIGLNNYIKRVSDIILAIIILILISPILCAVAVAVKLSSPGPILFKQRRYGLNGEEITVYKFRSMTVCEDGATVTQATKNDTRVTRVGGVLRRTSLDELPQFINVLQGRMSIVGPRPHAVAHNEMYRKLIKGYMLRHKVKPGITGWAQVHGFRGETDTLDKMESRVKYDLEYLRKWSVWLDIYIILRTVWIVLRKDNAY